MYPRTRVQRRLHSVSGELNVCLAEGSGRGGGGGGGGVGWSFRVEQPKDSENRLEKICRSYERVVRL